jgi:hypothetical protein
MSEFELLFKERDRLEKEVNLLNEKLEYLGKAFDETSSGSKRFELKKEKEEAEDRYDEVNRYLEIVRRKINELNVCRIFDRLLDLDCNCHVERFTDFITSQKAGAFFIQGSAKYSLRLLLKRLLQEISFCVTERPIIINLPSLFKHQGGIALLNDFDVVELLWCELGRQLRLRRPRPEQIVQKLSEKRGTQNIVLVLEELDSRYDLNEIIGKFWFDLADHMEQNSDYYFVMLLLLNDYNCLDDYCMDCFDAYDAQWRYRIPVRLPMLDKFEAEDLLDWMKRARGIFDIGFKKHASQTVEQIMNNCSGYPDEVIEYICTKICQCEFDEGILKRWLTF